MKLSPQDRKLMDRMAPGALSRDGFLGDDARPIGEILQHDNSTVNALGLTHEQIATELGKVLQAAMATYGTPVKVGEHLLASYRESMGRIPCPFADGVFPKGEVELTDTRSQSTVRFTPLSVHMIERHGFYQGRGSRYRLEPDQLARLLDLAH